MFEFFVGACLALIAVALLANFMVACVPRAVAGWYDQRADSTYVLFSDGALVVRERTTGSKWRVVKVPHAGEG